MSNWLTYSPTSGVGNGTITISAETLSELEDRVATLIAKNPTHSNLSATTVVTQKVFPTSITFTNLTWVTDVSWEGGTVSKDNCSYTIIANYADSTSADVTSLATVTGSTVVNSSSADTRHSAGTLTLTASYDGLTASASTQIYQEAIPPGLTEYLTFDIVSAGTINWNTDNSSNIQFSKDSGATWNTTVGSGSVIVSVGDRVMFRGEHSLGNFSGSTAGFNLTGNIMSLESGSSFYNITTITDSRRFNFLFYVCGKLYNASGLTLPAKTLANSCYEDMFGDCTSLTTAPELPATTLANNCYQYMFSGCKSLTTAPELPATTLAQGCYGDMFWGCTSLTTAPELPAETLANGCYGDMFGYCTGLTTAPVLPATTLTRSCYNSMFYNCTNLKYIKCLARYKADFSTYNWVYGVSSTGTFVKNPNMNNWSIDADGIPSGWGVIDDI